MGIWVSLHVVCSSFFFTPCQVLCCCVFFFGGGGGHLCGCSMASIYHYFARKQVGDTQKCGKPEMRSSCRNSLDLH